MQGAQGVSKAPCLTGQVVSNQPSHCHHWIMDVELVPFASLVKTVGPVGPIAGRCGGLLDPQNLILAWT